MPVAPLINGSYDESEERSQRLKDLKGLTLVCMGNELKLFARDASLTTTEDFVQAVDNKKYRLCHWSPALKDVTDVSVRTDAEP